MEGRNGTRATHSSEDRPRTRSVSTVRTFVAGEISSASEAGQLSIMSEKKKDEQVCWIQRGGIWIPEAATVFDMSNEEVPQQEPAEEPEEEEEDDNVKESPMQAQEAVNQRKTTKVDGEERRRAERESCEPMKFEIIDGDDEVIEVKTGAWSDPKGGDKGLEGAGELAAVNGPLSELSDYPSGRKGAAESELANSNVESEEKTGRDISQGEAKTSNTPDDEAG